MTDASHPLVTIVIPVFNGANYLAEAIESALAQTWRATEIIVVNDGSEDGGATQAIMDRYGARIRALHKSNGGVATALNLAIGQMRGEYLSWLSHDDLYDARKIERQLDAVLGLGRTAPCFSDADLMDSGGSFIRRHEAGGEDFLTRPLWAVLEGRINGCTMLVPRECLAQCGTFDPELPTTQDYDLWFRMALRYPFLHVPEPLVRQRIHDKQESRSAEHLNEASLLWMEMLGSIPSAVMIEYAGGVRAFYERVLAFLRNTTYAAATAGVEQMIRDMEPDALPPPAAAPKSTPVSPAPSHARRVGSLRRWVLRPSVERATLSWAHRTAYRHGPRTGRVLGWAIARLYGIPHLVDVQWYRQTYKDVAAANIDPVLHYLREGWREGRDPSPRLSTSRLLAAHPDIVARCESPWRHRAGPGGSEAPVSLAPPPDSRSRAWPRCHPQRPGALFILHDHGGGAARFAAEIARHVSDLVEVVFLRGRIDGAEICRSERGDDAWRFALPAALDDLVAALRGLDLKRVVVLHAMTLRPHIVALLQRLGLPFDTVFLDYDLAVEQPHLAGADGRFLGEDRLPVPIWPGDPARRLLIEGADRLVACSEDLAARLARLGIARPIRVAPPPEAIGRRRYRCRFRPPRPGESLRVITLGTILPNKGRDVMVATAKLARERGLPLEFHVLGDLRPPPEDAAGLFQIRPDAGIESLTVEICRIRPHVAWFPFQLPETHSYALSDAMSQGLPIVASAIGAVPDRLAGWRHAVLHRWDAPPAEWLDLLARVQTAGLPEASTPARASTAHARFYRTDFVAPLLARDDIAHAEPAR